MFKMPFRRQPHRQQEKIHLPNLKAEHIYLRFPMLDDYQEWATLRTESRAFLEPWEPLWPADAHTLIRYKSHLDRYIEGRKNGQFFVFFVFLNETNHLIGGISLGNIRRGVVQSGEIGYWCGEKYSGHGFMHESLELMIDFSFQQLKLHRLQAASVPTNTRSIALLEKCGFVREGLMRAYVKIHGEWQDHYLYSLLETERPIKSI
ncbi:GNAT domain [Bartonella apihabitans]|uniref:GNAT family N-acetyltransferase n=2 Tax=Bartonella TaxID=773 RepID=UPI00098F8C40|nr:ribosomal-protein-alanine N-acetyltransferase [Bartonella apihabitans]MBI0019687.1 GNAT family N-acetyltransferase [Bartonella apihabitans]